MNNIEQMENKEKQFCQGFSLLDERDKDYMLGILQALDFASKKREGTMRVNAPSSSMEGERQNTIMAI